MPGKTQPRTRRGADPRKGPSPFDRAVRRVLKELPGDLRAALSTVAISIQRRPTPALLKRLGLPSSAVLYGVFEGWDLRSLPAGEPRTSADRVILFEDALRRDFPDRRDLDREIRATLIHELGHYFGFSERELKARGWG